MTRKKRWMTRVESYAHHGSISYGEISPERFAEVVKGDTPTIGEQVRVCQGLTESPARPLNRENANELAGELEITREELEARCQELCGCAMGAHAFPEELPLPPRLMGKN